MKCISKQSLKKKKNKTKQNKTKTRETTHDIYTAMWMLHEQFYTTADEKYFESLYQKS